MREKPHYQVAAATAALFCAIAATAIALIYWVAERRERSSNRRCDYLHDHLDDDDCPW